MSEIIPTKNKVQIWRERIAAQIESGQSIRAFCEERQIKLHVFHYWKQKFGEPRGGSYTSRFIDVSHRSHPVPGSPRIHLPNGVKIELGESLESASVSGFIRSLCGVVYAKS